MDFIFIGILIIAFISILFFVSWCERQIQKAD